MVYNAGPYHIEIDIHQASYQMFPTVNCRGVITVFPKGALSSLPLIKSLRNSSGNHLNALWNDVPPAVDHKKMDMVRGPHKIQYAQPEALLRLK
jgi:hypothetical protein